MGRAAAHLVVVRLGGGVEIQHLDERSARSREV